MGADSVHGGGSCAVDARESELTTLGALGHGEQRRSEVIRRGGRRAGLGGRDWERTAGDAERAGEMPCGGLTAGRAALLVYRVLQSATRP